MPFFFLTMFFSQGPLISTIKAPAPCSHSQVSEVQTSQEQCQWNIEQLLSNNEFPSLAGYRDKFLSCNFWAWLEWRRLGIWDLLNNRDCFMIIDINCMIMEFFIQCQRLHNPKWLILIVIFLLTLPTERCGADALVLVVGNCGSDFLWFRGELACTFSRAR